MNDEQAETAIRQVQKEKVESLLSGDFAAWLALHSSDVLLIPPGENLIVGKDALRSWGEPYFDQYSIEDSERVDEVIASRNWGVLRYSYATRYTPKAGGDVLKGSGRGMLVLNRQSHGLWKIVRHIWNAAPATDSGD